MKSEIRENAMAKKANDRQRNAPPPLCEQNFWCGLIEANLRLWAPLPAFLFFSGDAGWMGGMTATGDKGGLGYLRQDIKLRCDARLYLGGHRQRAARESPSPIKRKRKPNSPGLSSWVASHQPIDHPMSSLPTRVFSTKLQNDHVENERRQNEGRDGSSA